MPQIKSWEVSDEFWARVEPLIPVRHRSAKRKYQRRPGGGRKPMPPRQVFSASVYVLRTGCQWKALQETTLCASSTAHDRYQEWVVAGVFERLWAVGLERFDECVGIDWEWMSMDGAMTKAPLGGEKNRA